MSRWSAFDQRALQWAAGLIGLRAGRWVFRLVAHSGDSQWWLLVGLALWWQGESAWRAAGQRMVIMTLVAGLVSSLLKRLIRRPRPAGEAELFYLSFDRHSFPSGHATRMGGLVVVLGAMVPAWGLAILILWGAAVGISRVALEIHYASDILGGWLLGALLGVIGLAAVWS